MQTTEANILAYAQLMDREVVRTGELCEPLNLTPKQERELLSRMARQELLVRLKRGVYLVPLKVPPGGKFAPGTARVLRALMQDIGSRYQVGGPNAFNAHGFDDQVPNLTFVYNDKLSGERTIGGCRFVFIKLAVARLGGTIEPPAQGEPGVPLTDIARTLVDAVCDWSRFNTLPRAYRWIVRAVQQDAGLPPRLADYTRRYGNIATGRRLGCLLERLGADQSTLQALRKYIGNAKSVIPWIPRWPATGPVSPWGVIVNGEVPDA